jgi:hypothetical protein
VGAAPNGHDRGAQINGSRAAPTFSAALSLTRMGPPSAVSSFCPPCPCCRVSPIHPSSLARVAFPSSHHPLIACHASRFFHISFSPKGESVSPVFAPSTWLSSAMDHHLSPLSVITLASHHHSCHTPCPPRWPLCPSLKLFGCPRWQREKYPLSRDAELVWPLSIPRSSY